MAYKTAVLCILDGWGHRDDEVDNAIRLANTPTYDRLWDQCPRAWLATSGRAVGLPDGQMGNSEIGHMNLGSGRVVMADLPRIDAAIADNMLAARPAIRDFLPRAQAGSGVVHLMGLVSPGGVHSHQDHMVALAGILNTAGLRVCVHAFLDGRDTPPQSGQTYLARFEKDLASAAPQAKIATVAGRFYAMDRDQRWDRVERAYQAIVRGAGERFDTADAAITAAYQSDKGDEFVPPAVIGSYAGVAPADALVMANFRADRAREILTALTDPDFDGFARNLPAWSATLGMIEYSQAINLHVPAIFPPEDIRHSFGEVLAGADLPQLRLAETEKYAHVTFFFSGGRETPFDGEDRILIPSPKVETYDLKPEMSAAAVTEALEAALASGSYAAIVVNYANPDMVGHTGNLDAAIKAVETVDQALARLERAVLQNGGVMLLTADHGNVELMKDQTTGKPHTAHTHFDVPVLLINAQGTLKDGRLADVAPTLLDLMQLNQPSVMTGQSLYTRPEAN